MMDIPQIFNSKVDPPQLFIYFVSFCDQPSVCFSQEIKYFISISFMDSPNAESTQANQSETTDLMLIKRIVWNVDMQRKIHKQPLPSMWYLSTKKEMINQKQLTLQLLNNLPDSIDSSIQYTQQQCTTNKQKIYFEDFSQIYSLQAAEQQSQEKTLAQINTELGSECQKLTMENKKLVQQLNEYRLKQIESDSNYRSECERKKVNYEYCNNYIKYLEQQIHRHKCKGKGKQPQIDKMEKPNDDYMEDIRYLNAIEEENRKLRNRLMNFQKNLGYLKSMGAYQSEEIKRLKADKEFYKRKIVEINKGTAAEINKGINISKQIIKDGNIQQIELNQLIKNPQQETKHQIPLKQDTLVPNPQNYKFPITQLHNQLQYHQNIPNISQNSIKQLIARNKKLQKDYETVKKNQQSLRVVVSLLQNQFEKLNKNLQRLRKSSSNTSQQI